MSKRDCDLARERIALGDDRAAADHLRACEECRREADALRRVVAALAAADIRARVPEGIDTRVRSLLAPDPVAGRPLLRPVPAVALGAAGVLSLLGSLSAGLSALGAGELSVPFACVATLAYLAVSAAASVPILIHGARSLPERAPEVHR